MLNNDFSVCREVISALGYMVGIDVVSEKFQLSPKDYCPRMMRRNIRAEIFWNMIFARSREIQNIQLN
jgi:hypothetical protein